MKILVVQDYLRSGGTERQAILLANAFAAAGHTVTLLTFRPGGALAPTANAAVSRLTLQPFDTKLDWFAPNLLRRVRSAQPDVVLCMGRMANCYAGSLQRHLPHAAVIGTLRTGKPLPRLFRHSLNEVRHIVANSREARDLLVSRHGIDAARIAVIYNALVFPPDRPADATARSTVRTRHGATPNSFVMLCVAMFRPEKKQSELIEIAAGLPRELDWQLWLAGDGPARRHCEQLAAQHQLTARVKFLGFLRDPSPLYAAADVAVHASASESLSNFFIEAQARGLPCVAYQAQGIGETFVPDRTGWVIPRDDRQLFRERILHLWSASPARHAAIAAEARAFARTSFDSRRQVSAYLDLFSKLVSRS